MEDSSAARAGGVRGRVRQAIRSELTAAAMASIESVGFARTTASDIAKAVGVSERTFFRYFATKEDAVLQPVEAVGADIAQGFHLGVPTPAEDIDGLIEALHGSIGVDAPRF